MPVAHRRQSLLLLLACTCLGAACSPSAGAGDAGQPVNDSSAVISLGPAVEAGFAGRYGINLGGPSAWGAEQLLANIVANPGFEPTLDRSLVTLTDPGAGHWTRELGWNSRPAGFWRGAQGHVLTGSQAGTRFSVVDDAATHQANQAHLTLDPPLPQLRSGDVVSLQAQTDTSPGLPARWWGQGRVSTAAGGPNGDGGCCVARLEPAHTGVTELSSYTDTLERAGRMLPVTGPWELRLALRSIGGQPAQVRVRFARDGGDVFLDQVLPATTRWEFHRLTFSGRESARGKGSLSLSLTLVQGSLDLDDIYLGEAAAGAGGFRQAVVDTLKLLQPGYLRDWQGQLGDTPDNRFASAFSRRPVRYRAGDAEVLHTHSAEQVLALSQAVGARPWLVLPTTFSATEAMQFGSRLRELAEQTQRDVVVVEFGNENWNPLFSAAGLVDVAAHREAAQRALQALRTGFERPQTGGPQLVTMVNARMDDAAGLQALGSLPQADRISVAPYFSYRFDQQTPLAQQLADAFAPASNKPLSALARQTTAMNKRLSAYELNLHTTEGNASEVVRNALVAGAASGPALARQLLAGSLAGMGEQAVYALAGFDAFTASQDLVRLFGVTRDLATAGRMRPTGVALSMLNGVAGGQVHTAHCQGSACSELTVVAFVSDRPRWALVNGHDAPRSIRLRGACAHQAPRLQLLDGHDPWLNNEASASVQAQEVTPACNGTDLTLSLPAHSLLTVD